MFKPPYKIKVESSAHQFGGTFVEFAITMAFLLVLIQSSIFLCEKIALKTWLENTSYQLTFSSSQAPSSARNDELATKRAMLFGIFNDRSKKFWKLSPFRSMSYNEEPGGTQQDGATYPDISWQNSTGGLYNLDVEGKAKSVWSGYGSTYSASVVYPLTSSKGYDSEYQTPMNSVVSASEVVFDCGSSGLDSQCTKCAGGNCAASPSYF